MKLTTVYPIAILVFSFFAILIPSKAYSPGELLPGHSKIGCGECHEPFKKPKGGTCIVAGCHSAGYWAKQKQIYIGHLEKGGCDKCHAEHGGRTGATSLANPHKEITGTSHCRKCHRAGASHAPIRNQDCKKCHTLNAWKPAQYGYCYNCHDHSPGKVEREHVKHGILHYASDPNCVRCHQTEREHELKPEPAR